MGKNWKRLHRLEYIIPPRVVVHFLLPIMGNSLRLYGTFTQPLIYVGIVMILLLVRVKRNFQALISLRDRIETWHKYTHIPIKLQKQK